MSRFSRKDFLKTALFALVVSIVAVMATFELQKFQVEEEVKETENRVVPFGSNEIHRIKYNEFTLERDGARFIWKVTSPYTDYLNYRLVEDWVSKGLSQDGRVLNEDGEVINWPGFSLDHRDNKILYITKKAEQALVQLSQKDAFDGSTYLKVVKNKTEWLYSSNEEWKKVFNQNIKYLRSPNLFDWEVPSPSSLLQKISFYKKNKIYFSLSKKGKIWASDLFPDWSFDEAKVNSYLNELQSYLHEGFIDKKDGLPFDLGDKQAHIVVNTSKKEEFALGFYRKQRAVASYRPEHTVRVDKEAKDSLMVDPLYLRSFLDVDGGLNNENIDQVRVKVKKESQTFKIKENIWVLKSVSKKYQKMKDEFNGARVFIFLKKIKELNHKRYVPKKGIVFRSDHKRIYLSQKGKELVKYSVGPPIACTQQDKRSKNCVVVSSSRLKSVYFVALKTEVDKLFKFNFYKEGS